MTHSHNRPRQAGAEEPEITEAMIEAGEVALTENLGDLLGDPIPRVCYETVRSILHAALVQWHKSAT